MTTIVIDWSLLVWPAILSLLVWSVVVTYFVIRLGKDKVDHDQLVSLAVHVSRKATKTEVSRLAQHIGRRMREERKTHGRLPL